MSKETDKPSFPSMEEIFPFFGGPQNQGRRRCDECGLYKKEDAIETETNTGFICKNCKDKR